MNSADAIFFAVVALADLALVVYLRRRRANRTRARRMMRSLEIAVHRENTDPQPSAPKRWSLGRAS